MLTRVSPWPLGWTWASYTSAECGSELCGTGQGEFDLGASVQTPCQSQCCACFSCQLLYGSNALGHISWQGMERKNRGIWPLASQAVVRREPLAALWPSQQKSLESVLAGRAVVLGTGGGCAGRWSSPETGSI